MIERLIGRPLHYGWLIVIVTFVTLITTAGFRATPGVLIVPLQHEFGWSRGTISLAVSLGLLLYGLAAPFSAALMERFGVRRVMLVALVDDRHRRVADDGDDRAVAARPAVGRPRRRRDRRGRGAARGDGREPVVHDAPRARHGDPDREQRERPDGVPAGARVARDRLRLALGGGLGRRWSRWWSSSRSSRSSCATGPQSIGLEPYGATEPVPVPERSAHPFRPAIDGLLLGVGRATFWLLSATFFICGLSTNGLIGTHLIPAAIDHHMTAVRGASLLALMGVFDVIGTTCSGWLTDRLDPRHLLAWYYALPRPGGDRAPVRFGSAYALFAFAVFYGLDWVATVPPTVALTAEHFGRERVGIVFGWVFASHQFGAAFAAWAAGASRGWFGTYTYAFLSAGALCLLAAGLSLRIGARERTTVPIAAPAVA